MVMKHMGTPHFTINGYKVIHKDGLAEFLEFGVLIRIPHEEFTYDWAVKMQYKLSVLKTNNLLGVK